MPYQGDPKPNQPQSVFSYELIFTITKPYGGTADSLLERDAEIFLDNTHVIKQAAEYDLKLKDIFEKVYQVAWGNYADTVDLSNDKNKLINYI
jgi:hypothetical protein